MSATLSEWLGARLSSNANELLYRRLMDAMLDAIDCGQLVSGSKLPSSRTLSEELKIARNTITHVYDLLKAEGYLVTHAGSGTYVADVKPERVQEIDIRRDPALQRHNLRLSQRGQRTIEMASAGKRQWGAFMPGVPDVTQFPLKAWNRIQNRIWSQSRPEMMTYAKGGGYRPLRRALADYVRTSRAANCKPEQVVLTTGIHQSVDLAIRLLCDVGDEVWVEDPCYWGVRNLLLSSGLVPIPIPVDEHGINPGPRHLAKPPRVIICTPSHQYPLGYVMSLSRRRLLLEYAAKHDCWIIEDDYDSEFRYGIDPLASLQGLDRYGQVIYVSSFSKVLFPSMRTGFMVVPESMADFFAQGSAELFREGNVMLQATLTEFIDEGHMHAHIRRMKGLYGERRNLLIQEIRRLYGNELSIRGGESGLHVVLDLPPSIDDSVVSQQGIHSGVLSKALSTYYASNTEGNCGLLLGYACVKNEDIKPAFSKLSRIMDAFL